jgi:hypothetical protein
MQKHARQRQRLAVFGASPRLATWPEMNAAIGAEVTRLKHSATTTGASRRRSWPGLRGRFLALAEVFRLVTLTASQIGPKTARK